MSSITPFLWFEKGAREAAEFYVSVFGGDSRIERLSVLKDTPSGTVEIVDIRIKGQRFSLMSGGPFAKFNEAISFVVTCDTQEELDRYWNMLSAVPEEQQCGWLKDRFGVSWQIVPRVLGELMGDADQRKVQRVQKALLAMKKIIISDLQKAYDTDTD